MKKILKSQRGVILIAVFMVIAVISVILTGYVTWSIWDQKNLLREQNAEEAKVFAQAGLNRAVLDLRMDNTWVDGKINNTIVAAPNPSNPDDLFTLYADQALGPNGNYTVKIKYLKTVPSCSSGCSFYSDRILVSSSGKILNPATTITLEQYVDLYPVKNITMPKFYFSLQPGINEVRNNDSLRITYTTLIENIAISGKTYTVRGCCDSDFQPASCIDFPSTIQGNASIGAGANVTLSNLIIRGNVAVNGSGTKAVADNLFIRP